MNLQFINGLLEVNLANLSRHDFYHFFTDGATL